MNKFYEVIFTTAFTIIVYFKTSTKVLHDQQKIQGFC